MLVWCNANTQVGVLLLFRSLRCASRGLSAVRVVGPVGEVHFSGRAFYFAKKKPQTGGLGARWLRCDFVVDLLDSRHSVLDNDWYRERSRSASPIRIGINVRQRAL